MKLTLTLTEPTPLVVSGETTEVDRQLVDVVINDGDPAGIATYLRALADTLAPDTARAREYAEYAWQVEQRNRQSARMRDQLLRGKKDDR